MADTTPRKDLSFRFAGLPPAIKLSIWLGSIVVLAAAIQSIAWGVGAHFHILHASGGGRGVLLAIALCTLLAIMAVDGRPAAEYGIVAHAGWRRHLFGGVLVGLLIHTGYWMLLAVGGIASVQARGLSGSLCLKATLLAFSAMPVSMVQQIIFSGYLLGILRDRYSRVVAVVVPAILFAVLRRIDNPSLLLNPDSRPELLGMFLLGVLLGSVRLQTGSIFRSAGLLAGLIFVRRWLRVTPLLAVGPSGHWGRWMAFDQDPLQSPAVWLMLAGAIAWVAYRLYRDGEPRAVLQPAADFKRVFPFSNSNMLTPLDVWLGRLADARFQVDFAYVPRLAAILVLSTINTLLTAVERILTPILVWDHQPASPVIIVGVHRSGTTHLHNLLALDPQFTTPRAYQVLNPAGFLLYSWLVAPLLAAFLPWRRPMDGVRFHAFAPQEDEFALAGMCGNSPHWGMTFPRRWAAYDRSIFPADWSRRERRVWQRCLRLFLAKLTYWSGKRPLLKNPYHTGRAALLQDMFPYVRFIHVYRHPYDVYRSNMHLAEQGHVVNQLQDPDPDDCYQTRFLDNYLALETAYYRETAGLPSNQAAEVRFEDLERDPIGELRRLYAELELNFSPQFESQLRRYLDEVADYQKNRFRDLPEHDRREIDATLGSLLVRWGYCEERQRTAVRKAA